MASLKRYRHLEQRPGSNYQQLWVKGRHMRAEVLYRCTVGPEPRTPEEVAADYQVPLDAVLEAIAYAAKNEALLTAERQREDARVTVLPPSDMSAPAQHPSEV